MLNDEFLWINKNKYEDQLVEQIKKRKLDLEEEINEERKMKKSI